MATEVLVIPEAELPAVITIIRAGCAALRDKMSPETVRHLLDWCDEEDEYLDSLLEE